MIIEDQYMIQLPPDGPTHDLIAFDPSWIDSSDLPHGAIAWGDANLRHKDSAIFMCFLMDLPAIVELHRFDNSVGMTIALGPKIQVKMGENHYTVYSTVQGRDEERRYERRMNKQGGYEWVATQELKLNRLPTALNCPPTIWFYQREVSRQLCLRWNDNAYGELLVAVDDVLGRYTIFNGPTTREMAKVFYDEINVLDLTHPLDDKDKRWLHPQHFFSILKAAATAIGVDETALEKIRTAFEEAARKYPL